MLVPVPGAAKFFGGSCPAVGDGDGAPPAPVPVLVSNPATASKLEPFSLEEDRNFDAATAAVGDGICIDKPAELLMTGSGDNRGGSPTSTCGEAGIRDCIGVKGTIRALNEMPAKGLLFLGISLVTGPPAAAVCDDEEPLLEPAPAARPLKPPPALIGFNLTILQSACSGKLGRGKEKPLVSKVACQ